MHGIVFVELDVASTFPHVIRPLGDWNPFVCAGHCWGLFMRLCWHLWSSMQWTPRKGMFWEGQEAAQHIRGGLMFTDVFAVHFMVPFVFYSFTYIWFAVIVKFPHHTINKGSHLILSYHNDIYFVKYTTAPCGNTPTWYCGVTSVLYSEDGFLGFVISPHFPSSRKIAQIGSISV